MRHYGLAVIFALLVAACGGGDSTEPTEAPAPGATEAPATTPAATEAPQTTTTTAPVAVGEPPVLNPPCSYIDADELGAVTGTEMVIDEEFGSACFYLATGDMGPDVDTEFYVLPPDQCPGAMQTEPMFGDESVEPVDSFGDAAVLVVGASYTEIDVCNAGFFFAVYVDGGDGTSAEERLSIAEAVVELLLDRL